MLRTNETTLTGGRVSLAENLWRYSRAVQVDVLDWGHLADSFRISNPAVLGEATAPIYKHLPQEGVAVRFRGIEERSLPFGLRRTIREIDLCDLLMAQAFLED